MRRPQKPLGWQTGMLTIITGCLVAGCVFATWNVSLARTEEPSVKKKTSGKVARAAKAKFAAKKFKGAKPNTAKATTAPRDDEQHDSKPATQAVPAGSKEVAKSTSVSRKSGGTTADAIATAAEVDRHIEAVFAENKITPAGIVNDEDFLRRVSMDLAGTLPTAKEVTLFGLDPDPAKRSKLIDQMLVSDDYALNWSRYWRDVIFLRATNERARLMIGVFEDWMADQLRKNVGWDDITHSLITATGDIQEKGETALVYVHEGNAEEIAGETSRIFLGIQMQCANCHDHPTEKWNRDQFHSLAAFFPRITLRREPGDIRSVTIVSFNERGPNRPPFQMLVEGSGFLFERFDTNKDSKLTKAEAEGSPLGRGFDRILELADTNKDSALTIEEIKKMPPPPQQQGRGSAEHYMADLKHPNEQGKLMTPAFFLTSAKGRVGMDDEDRRELLAKFITSPTNPWFAKAIVNRLWGELLGEGFFMPIDDMGPERKARMPEALDYLATEFVKHDHDVKWLLRTITLTRAYQRQVQYREPSENPVPFAAATPTRLRADQLFNAVVKVLGVDEGPRGVEGPMARFRRTPRGVVEELFGFDPSTPQDELLGNVPQALYLMNFPGLANALRADGNTRLGQILMSHSKDEEAISELYLAFLSRDPSHRELKIGQDYIQKVGNRREAFEDLAWSLLNSSEFLSKR